MESMKGEKNMKKNFVKRAFCLALGMTMLVGSMAGCGKKGSRKG